MSLARSISQGIARDLARLVSLADGAAAALPTPPYNQLLIVDKDGKYVRDRSSKYITGFQNFSISIAVEDGASSPRSLTAADIDYIGYWQIFSSVRATPGSVEFTPVDLASAGAAWTSGGIYDSPAGTLRIDLPVHALVGDPDEIEIEITPVSGTVVLPSPIVTV